MSQKGRIICCCFMALVGLKCGWHTAKIFEAEWYVTAAVMILYSLFGFWLLWKLTDAKRDDVQTHDHRDERPKPPARVGDNGYTDRG